LEACDFAAKLLELQCNAINAIEDAERASRGRWRWRSIWEVVGQLRDGDRKLDVPEKSNGLSGSGYARC
jgi:hypothetical protein